MAQPLYFLPDLREAAAKDIPARRAVLRERGLLDVFADVAFEQQQFWELPGRGPGDKPGCILGYQTTGGSVPRRLGYFPNEQTWTPIGDGSLLWIGVDSAEGPKPEEMAREAQIRGYRIKLNEQFWLVPVIRRPNNGTCLPSAFVRDAAGRMVEQVRTAYAGHWEAFRDVAAWAYGGFAEDAFGQAAAVDLAIKALGINYRFGANEQDILQVVGSDNLHLIIGAAVDLPSFDETTTQKKMNDCSQEQSSTLGRPENSQTTSPVGATSN